jgi:hypothetical protein
MSRKPNITMIKPAILRMPHENVRFDGLVYDAIRFAVDFQKFPNIDPVELRNLRPPVARTPLP